MSKLDNGQIKSMVEIGAKRSSNFIKASKKAMDSRANFRAIPKETIYSRRSTPKLKSKLKKNKKKNNHNNYSNKLSKQYLINLHKQANNSILVKFWKAKNPKKTKNTQSQLKLNILKKLEIIY